MNRSRSGFGSVLSWLLSIASLAIIVGAVNNVLGDTSEVDQMAAKTACLDQGPHCKAQLSIGYRNPLGHTFEFVTAKRTVAVTCHRSLYVFGDYNCTTPSASLRPRPDVPTPVTSIH